MNIKRNPLKILTALFAAFIVAIFGSSSFTVLSLETKTSSQEILEERLAKVRQRLRQQEEYKPDETSQMESSPDKSKAEIEENLVSQWYNWGNWGNWDNWGNWGNWGNWPNWGNY